MDKSLYHFIFSSDIYLYLVEKQRGTENQVFLQEIVGGCGVCYISIVCVIITQARLFHWRSGLNNTNLKLPF